MLTGSKQDWFRRDSDERRAQIKVISSLKLQFYATHEICLVVPSGIVRPFARSTSEKVTTMYRPRQGNWQIEEIQLLRDSGWTVSYQSAMLPDEESGDSMLCAEEVSGEHALISENTKATIVSADKHKSAKMIEDYLRDANLTASDDAISINLLGQSVLAGHSRMDSGTG
jgi:hypothetical protein